MNFESIFLVSCKVCGLDVSRSANQHLNGPIQMESIGKNKVVVADAEHGSSCKFDVFGDTRVVEDSGGVPSDRKVCFLFEDACNSQLSYIRSEVTYICCLVGQ